MLTMGLKMTKSLILILQIIHKLSFDQAQPFTKTLLGLQYLEYWGNSS
jgi:hypothetical protein